MSTIEYGLLWPDGDIRWKPNMTYPKIVDTAALLGLEVAGREVSIPWKVIVK